MTLDSSVLLGATMKVVLVILAGMFGLVVGWLMVDLIGTHLLGWGDQENIMKLFGALVGAAMCMTAAHENLN